MRRCALTRVPARAALLLTFAFTQRVFFFKSTFKVVGETCEPTNFTGRIAVTERGAGARQCGGFLIEMCTSCAFNDFDCVHSSVSLTKQADFNCSLFPSIVKESRFHNTRFNPKVRSFPVSSCAVFCCCFFLFFSFRTAHPQREIDVLHFVFFKSNMHHEVAPFYFRLLLQQWPIVISADEAAGLFETKYV